MLQLQKVPSLGVGQAVLVSLSGLGVTSFSLRLFSVSVVCSTAIVFF